MRTLSKAILWLLVVTLTGPASAVFAQSAEDLTAPKPAGEVSEGEYLKRLTTEPDNPVHYLDLARLFIARSEPQRVSTLLIPAAERWLGRGQYAAAAEVLELAVELEPNSARYWSLLGRARTLNRQFRAAEPALRRAMELDSDDLQTGLLLSSALWENGSLEVAEQLLLELRARHGDSPLLAHHLGSMRLWQGRFADAIGDLERVVGSRPDWIGARLDLARALEGAGESAAARRHFEAYLERVPGDAGARYGLASALMAIGERDLAAGQMEIYATIRERERQELLTEGRLDSALDEAAFLVHRGRSDEAIEQLEQLPRNVDVLEALSWALQAQADPVAAVEVLEEALALDPSRLDLRLRLQDLRAAARRTETLPEDSDRP